jgi:glucokinase
MGLSCGIDVGGTKIAGAVVDDHGKILEHRRVESPANEVEAIEDAIAGLVADLRTRHDVDRVGLGAAGYVDASRAKVIFAPNLAWRDLDLRAELEDRIDLPVTIENDANAAAWGEFRFGGGEDVEDFLMVTVGTGVGGGIVLGGELQRGAFGFAAEIGHLRVVPDGRDCGCGNRGCFEQYASGSALLRNVRDAVIAGVPDVAGLLERAGGDPAAISGPLVTAAAHEGDAFAVEQLAALGDWLGQGVASLITVLDPAAIVVGGGVSEAGDLLLEPMRRSFVDHLSVRGHRPVAEIRLAQLGNEAGVIGAADLARR